jgi:hypothetical protein
VSVAEQKEWWFHMRGTLSFGLSRDPAPAPKAQLQHKVIHEELKTWSFQDIAVA